MYKISIDQYKALSGSIEKWSDIVDETGTDKGFKNCPLCIYHARACKNCIVQVDSNKSYCGGTPYDDIIKFKHVNYKKFNLSGTHEYIKLAQAELNYLLNLRSRCEIILDINGKPLPAIKEFVSPKFILQWKLLETGQYKLYNESVPSSEYLPRDYFNQNSAAVYKINSDKNRIFLQHGKYLYGNTVNRIKINSNTSPSKVDQYIEICKDAYNQLIKIENSCKRSLKVGDSVQLSNMYLKAHGQDTLLISGSEVVSIVKNIITIRLWNNSLLEVDRQWLEPEGVT